MNILLLNWRDPKNQKSGGAEKVTLEHAKRWVKAGHTVTWLATSYPKANREEVFDSITFIRKGNVLTQFILFPFYYLKNRHSIDLVVDQIHGLPYLTPLYVKKKKIGFIHEVAGDIWDSMYPFPLNILGHFLERLCFLLYKNIPFLTVSESTKKDLQKLGIKNVRVVHNGVSYIQVTAKKEKHPTFIFVSRLVKMKGIEDILDAFKMIFENEQEAQLWVVGNGTKRYIDELKKKVEELGLKNNVIFWGHVDEQTKFSLLKKAHILLHASVKEGWGLVVIEAASQGTPAVVYNVSGLRDSVKDNVTGYVIKNNTPGELSQKALELYHDLKSYHDMQLRCVSWAKSLTWEESTKSSLQFIESI